MPKWRAWSVAAGALTAALLLAWRGSTADARRRDQPALAPPGLPVRSSLGAPTGARAVAQVVTLPVAATVPPAHMAERARPLPGLPAPMPPDPRNFHPSLVKSDLESEAGAASPVPNEALAEWEAEAPNEQATARHQQYLEAALHDLEVRAQIQSVDCRTTLCRVKMEFADFEEALEFDGDASKKHQRKRLAYEMSDGGVRVDVLLSAD